MVVCGNSSVYHALLVRQFVTEHQGLHLWFGTRYSPHDNPTERI